MVEMLKTGQRALIKPAKPVASSKPDCDGLVSDQNIPNLEVGTKSLVDMISPRVGMHKGRSKNWAKYTRLQYTLSM